MATMKGLLKSQLLQDFFTTVTRVRAKGTYTRTSTDGNPDDLNPNVYSQNTIGVSFTFDATADDPTDVVAKLVNAFEGDDPLYVLVDATNNDEFEVNKLEFIDEAEEVYLEWVFSSGELVFTGNGEIHIEDIEIKMA